KRLIQQVRQQAQRQARDRARYDEVCGRDRDDQEPPEDEQVVLARTMLRAFLRDLLLAEEVDADIGEATGDIVEARPRVGDSRGDRTAEQPNRACEERDRRREQEDKQD